jgi:hypothetical protein
VVNALQGRLAMLRERVAHLPRRCVAHEFIGHARPGLLSVRMRPRSVAGGSTGVTISGRQSTPSACSGIAWSTCARTARRSVDR